jgi:hypothetical protein
LREEKAMKDQLTGRKIEFNIDEGCDKDYEFEEEEIPAFDKHFAGIFMGVLNDAAEIYASHLPEKGESWMLDSVDQILSLWVGEIGEVLSLIGSTRYNPQACRRELLDVINLSLMVAKRIDDL